MAQEVNGKVHATAQKCEAVVYLDGEEVTTLELIPITYSTGSTGFDFQGNFVDQESGDGFWTSLRLVLKGSKKANK